MQGKQRSKTKPSSSAHAAELLGSAVSTASGNVFAQISAAYTGQSVEAYNGEDSELVVSLRKLLKKDSTTKLKALRDIQSIFTSREASVVVEALPQWCYAYQKLALLETYKAATGLPPIGWPGVPP